MPPPTTSTLLATPTDPPAPQGVDKGRMAHEKQSEFPLLELPTDVIRRILQHADIITLAALSETTHRLLTEILDDSLWKHIAIRRFRVTPRTVKSRRLQAAGQVSWRILYANWHLQSRMPVSRYSGPNVGSFAKGSGGGACAWMTVPSTNDCRLRNGGMRFRIVVQNVSARRVCVRPTSVAMQIQSAGVVVAGVAVAGGGVGGCSLSVFDTVVERGNGGGMGLVEGIVLGKDDFVVVSGDVRVRGAVFEIDVLERIECVVVPIVADDVRFNVKCPMSDRHIWDAYELLPGGWWARVG